MVGEVLSLYKQIVYLPSGQPTNWRTIISQSFFHRSETCEPHVRLFSLGVWHQSIWHWSPVGLEGRSTQDWRKQRLHPWRGQTRFCMHLVPGQSSDFSGIWTWPISGSRRVSWWGRSHCFQVSRTPEAETPRNNHWPELSRRSPLWTWPHRRAYRLQCWEASGQTTNRLGTQPHLSADRLPKVSWDTQPPLNIPLNTALLTKRTRPTNQGAGTSPSHHCRTSQARGWIRAAAPLTYATDTTTLVLSHICDLHHSSVQHRILNPLRGARDQTHVLMDTSRAR